VAAQSCSAAPNGTITGPSRGGPPASIKRATSHGASSKQGGGSAVERRGAGIGQQKGDLLLGGEPNDIHTRGRRREGGRSHRQAPGEQVGALLGQGGCGLGELVWADELGDDHLAAVAQWPRAGAAS
jgi:hypothetical protein